MLGMILYRLIGLIADRRKAQEAQLQADYQEVLVLIEYDHYCGAEFRPWLSIPTQERGVEQCQN